MLPNLREVRNRVGLRSMEPRPVGQLPCDEAHAENRANGKASQGQSQLGVANRMASYYGARTRQSEIRSQTSPGRLAAKRPAWSEGQRDSHRRTSARPGQRADLAT